RKDLDMRPLACITVLTVGGVTWLLGHSQDPVDKGTTHQLPTATPVRSSVVDELTGWRPAKKWDVGQLRKQYAYESLAERLEYETKHATKTASVPLTEAAAKRLADMEKTLEGRGRWDVRTKSLKMLHSNEVEQFIRRDGFGVERVPSPAPQYLELPAADPIPLVTLPPDDTAASSPPE